MILVIDNYDSFVYNLVQYLGDMGEIVEVRRNDAISADEAVAFEPDAIIISPGPCTPGEAGISVELIKKAAGTVPILGVCLGHQAIIAAFDGEVVRDKAPTHGKTSLIHHDGKTLFSGVPNPFDATRYHSLVGREESLPGCLEVSARTSDGTIMGVRHRDYQVEGIQFHPESILTTHGKQILTNFTSISREKTGSENG
jgi:para-aminobenzoate synthetase component 2